MRRVRQRLSNRQAFYFLALSRFPKVTGVSSAALRLVPYFLGRFLRFALVQVVLPHYVLVWLLLLLLLPLHGVVCVHTKASRRA